MKTVRALLNTLFETKAVLRELGVIRSERFTGELGEWLGEIAYNGKRATVTSQKGWDVEAAENGIKSFLQVKAHAKGKNNNARWTEIDPNSLELFDRLIIIVLSDDYFIKQWLDIPKESLRKILIKSGKSWVVRWDDAKTHSKNWQELPGGNGLSEFSKK
jgi:hypothetical protein